MLLCLNFQLGVKRLFGTILAILFHFVVLILLFKVYMHIKRMNASLKRLTFDQLTSYVLRAKHDCPVNGGKEKEGELSDIFSSIQNFHLAHNEHEPCEFLHMLSTHDI